MRKETILYYRVSLSGNAVGLIFGRCTFRSTAVVSLKFGDVPRVPSGKFQGRNTTPARFVVNSSQFIFISQRTVRRQMASDTDSVVKKRKINFIFLGIF
jgi:hypothetical protein